MLGDAGKLMQPAFSKAPERLDAVDVGRALDNLIVAVLDPIMTVVAHRRSRASHRC